MKKNKKIAFFFIGQSPRPDMMEYIYKTIGSEYGISEYGALDGLNDEEIAVLAPSDGKDTLITKLRDGRQVCVGEGAVEKLLAEKLLQAQEDGADAAAIMCTGEFDLECSIPVITADDAFHKLQTIPENCRKIGVIVPKAEQQEVFSTCYKTYGLPVISGAADPYGSDETIAAEAKRLAKEGADIICLDCMGFTPDQAEKVRMACGKETRVPRTEIIKAIKEII
ncbi:MAG: AroM family protein [Clostridia bacterium]|nr:AroM family protein [Clostridia bacterium]